MIKGLNGGSGVTISNSYSSWPQFYNSNSSNTLVGQVRYNGNNQVLEVYDGNSWLVMGASYPTIELAPHVQAVVAWAQVKIAEEARLEALAREHPTVADALAVLRRAEEQVQIVAALAKT